VPLESTVSRPGASCWSTTSPPCARTWSGTGSCCKRLQRAGTVRRGRNASLRGVFTEPLERLLRDAATDGSPRAVDPVESATD
jgi:hypothetical protein